MSERRCKRCEKTLPLTAFNRYKDGHQWWCRECFKVYFRERGRKHLEQVEKSRSARRERAHDYVLTHLRTVACVDCGERDPLVLEFDHLGDKVSEVGTLVGEAKRIDLIAAEIAKCAVVCCNCHRRRTYVRRGVTRTRESAERVKDWRIRSKLEWVYNVLSQSSCADCGLADPLVLEFDHVGMKRKNVMSMVWEGYGDYTIQIEMNKCEIRCASCHRRKTHAERNTFRHRAGAASEPPAKMEPDGPLA